MTKKLTLTVNDTTIEKAKLYAKANGKSVSQLVEDYLDRITEEAIDQDMKPSKKLLQLFGSVSLPDGFDEEKELNEYYENKHL